MTKENKKRLLIAGLCLLVGYVAGQVPPRITINKTGSVKYHFFWSLSPDPAKLSHGQYVRANVNLVLPGYDCAPCSIVKKVGCRAGEHLESQGSRFFCNTQPLCEAMAGHDPFYFSGIIPEGKVFLIGDSPNSYDSRYFGFIEKGAIDAILRPIL
jgi:conjugal transfer pilin signal peptidase TrbI